MQCFKDSPKQLTIFIDFLLIVDDVEDSVPPNKKNDQEPPPIARKKPEKSRNDGNPVLANKKTEDTGSDISDGEEAGYCDDSSTDNIYIRMKLEPIKDRELKNLYNNTDEVSIGIKTIDLTSVLLQQ